MDDLTAALRGRFSAAPFGVAAALGEATLTAPAAGLDDTFLALRDELRFAQLTDLAGVDYADFAGPGHKGGRFAVVYHFLSLADNRRLRLRVFCEDDDFPALPTASTVWPAANWFEREAFDLFGIVFHGHEDLRRLLTDYGFVGHPFRKDFPLSGNVEMRYDPAERRVVYQPVSIPPREVTPRLVRDEGFGEELGEKIGGGQGEKRDENRGEKSGGKNG